MKTAAVFVLVTLLCVAIAVGYAFSERRLAPGGGLPRELDAHFREAFDASLSGALALGLDEVRDDERGSDPVEEGVPWSRRIEIPQGECVAFVAAPLGCVEVESANLTVPGADQPLVERNHNGLLVTHLQWCAWLEPASIEARLTLQREHGCDATEAAVGHLEWRVQRGPVSGVAGTSAMVERRNMSNPEALDEAAALAWLAAREVETPLFDPVQVGFEQGAALIPDSAATCHSIYALVNEAGPVPPPRLAEANRESCPPSQIERADPTDPVRRREDGGWDRVLAVVDRGALGAPCVEVEIVRLRLGRRVLPVRRVEVGGEAPVALDDVGGQGFVFSDRACPASGVMAYLVSAMDQADYWIGVRATATPEGIVASAAPQPTGPFPTNPALTSPLEERCEQGDVEACDEAARARLEGEGVAANHDRALQLYVRGCELGSAEGCAYHGDSLLPSDEGRALLARACDGRYALACARLGDIERRTAGAPDEAMERAQAFYRRACGLELATACANFRLMIQHGLAPPRP